MLVNMGENLEMFPARAGMSRVLLSRVSLRVSAPRASGDEPKAAFGMGGDAKCSPRERG